MKIQEAFSHFARRAARITGQAWVFILALSLLLVWAATGPIFGFSDTWQLVINTATTIITFLMVFIIQNTQNRDTEALQIKLDEVINSIKGAKVEMMDVEELTEEDLDRLRTRYEELAKRARKGKGSKGKEAA